MNLARAKSARARWATRLRRRCDRHRPCTGLRFTARADKNLSWDDLLKESRVVVLGEPGSGKTWELRERFRLLAGRGEFAFFIRPDRLVGRELKNTLECRRSTSFH